MVMPVVLFIFGVILLGIAVTGGAFVLKDVQLPKLSVWTRLLSTIFGVFFVLLGFGIWLQAQTPAEPPAEVVETTPSPVSPTEPTAVPPEGPPFGPSPVSVPPTPGRTATASSIRVVAVDELQIDPDGNGQVSNEVTLTLGGIEKHLYVERARPRRETVFNLPEAGEYDYTLKVTTEFNDHEPGQICDHTAENAGTIRLVDGSVLGFFIDVNPRDGEYAVSLGPVRQ